MGVDTGISKSEVSRICAALDERVAAFRNRTLGHTTFPYVYLDATYVHVRDDALGQVVSRAVVVATGITAEGGTEILGVDIGDSEDATFWTPFRSIFALNTAEQVRARWDEVANMHTDRFPKAADLLNEAKDDVLAFAVFPESHWPKIWSNSPLERLNKEIKRRTNVIGIFPKRPGSDPTHRRSAR